ncbi:MAG: hypothetical protein ACK58Q_00045 [Chitinophagales bacterium]|jgi:hypothetical protein
MKNYNVTIKGIQSHIKGNFFENQSENQVELILDKYLDSDFCRPKFDGNYYELNGDQVICIEESI